MIRIQNLMEDKPSDNMALTAEHGLSFFVETAKHCFLFDCGSSGTFLKNAHRLGVNLKKAQFAVCSHSHYDHAAGFRDLTEQNLAPDTLYTGPGFMEKKYAMDGIRYTDLSCGFDEKFLTDHHIKHVEVNGLLKLDEGLWLISNFTRSHTFETIPTRFVKGNGLHFIPDDFGDEVCLVLATSKGLIVLTGCSHSGILNIISTIHEKLHQSVYAVIGGTHLMEADQKRIDLTFQELQHLGVKVAGFCHCSGAQAIQCLKNYPDLSGCHVTVGDNIFLDE
jgi:7,8-dihydropterin-6-yl-methyl-4-(beta-D-ribofuranosyl)aminobenzene 5'-phosphate synthase